MSGPVDVLAVLKRSVDQHWNHHDNADAEDAEAARAAVAELIEAGNAWCDLMPGLAGGPEFDRLKNALARVGGAS